MSFGKIKFFPVVFFLKTHSIKGKFTPIVDSPHNPMQVIFFNELAVSEQRIKNAMSTFGELTQEPFQVFDVSIFA